MIHLQVNPNSGEPIYRQVADQIRRYVNSGLLAPGAPLPSVPGLASSLAVNPSSIVKAYSELQHEDIVEMKAQRWGRVSFLVSYLIHFLP
jgi:GntR family transcriptional regulator